MRNFQLSKWLFPIVALFLSSFAFAAADDHSSKAQSSSRLLVLSLEQHGSVLGAQVVYLTPKAMRIDCTKKRTTILCRAPDWKVCSYSLFTRKYFETMIPRYSTLLKTILFIYGLDISSCQLNKTGEEKFLGRQCSVYKPVDKTPADKNSPARRYRGIWLADDIKIAAQAGDLLEREMGLPPLHKVLMKMDYLQDNCVTHALTTTYCHERLVPSDWFDLPPGLVKAKANADVYPGDSFTQFLP